MSSNSSLPRPEDVAAAVVAKLAGSAAGKIKPLKVKGVSPAVESGMPQGKAQSVKGQGAL